MKNILIKNYLMCNNKSIIKMLDISTNGSVTIHIPYGRSEVYYNRYYERAQSNCNIKFNHLEPNRLIRFDYRNLYFNMIPCPNKDIAIVLKKKFEDRVISDKTVSWTEIHKVKKPFILAEKEVTQELFESIMGFNYSRFKCPENPVEMVSWYDCLAFCNKLSDYFGLNRYYTIEVSELGSRNAGDQDLVQSIRAAKIEENQLSNGFRLPLDSEWQVAAKADLNGLYSGAKYDTDLNMVAWNEDNSNNQTHPVAQKKPNEWGFYDMSGNVMEWCMNKYDNSDKSPLAERVVRGGSWAGVGAISSEIQGVQPFWRKENLGFRIARNLT